MRMMFAPKVKESVFVCQVTDHAIKAVKCVRNNSSGFSPVAAGWLPVSIELDEQKAGLMLAEVLRGLSYAREPLLMAISRSQATTRYLKVPTQDPSEISRMVSLQAPRLIPFAGHELITGFEVIDRDQQGYAGINVSIVHRNVVDRALRTAGILKPASVSCALTTQGLCALYFSTLSKPYPPGAVVLVEIDGMAAEAVVASEGKALSSRAFKVHKDPVLMKQAVLAEVRKTVQAYADEGGALAVSRAVVFAGSAAGREAAGSLQQGMGIPAESFDLSRAVSFPERQQELLASSGISVASLAGLGIGPLDDALNLLPASQKELAGAAGEQKRRLQVLYFAALVFLVFAAASAIDMFNKQRYVGYLKSELARVSREAKPLDEAEKRFRLLSRQSRGRANALDMLYEIHRVLPQQVLLSSFVYEDEGRVVLRGSAQQMQEVLGIIDALQKSPAFAGFTSRVRYATKKQVLSNEVIDFEIACQKGDL